MVNFNNENYTNTESTCQLTIWKIFMLLENKYVNNAFKFVFTKIDGMELPIVSYKIKYNQLKTIKRISFN